MTPINLQELQKKAEIIAREAGDIALSNLGKIRYETKGSEGDLVTAVDREIEEFISGKLKGLIDGASIFGEELGGDLSSKYTWLIDPIDGSKNFAHSMPSFFIHIALLDNMNPVIGVIYDPVANKLFSSSMKNGAFINEERVFVSESIDIERAVIDIDFGGKEDLDWKTDIFRQTAKKVYRVRITAGRYAPYLLTGGIDAFIVLNPTTQLFDQAPRIILAKEAGLDVNDFDRKTWKIRIMSNPSLTAGLSEIIMNH